MASKENTPLFVPTDKPMSVAVFISGLGTNFEAIWKEQKLLEKSENNNYAKIDTVFTNVPNCTGAIKAKECEVSVLSLSSKSFFNLINKNPDDTETRKYYDASVVSLIEQVCSPDLIVLAGYRRKLSEVFFDKYENKIINLYPGDTTKDYLVTGVTASLQALRNNEKEIKCSVYIQKKDRRFGPVIAQSKPISLDGYNEKQVDQIDEKIRKDGEWKVFPFVVHELIGKGRVSIDSDNNIYIDGKMMSEKGYQL